MSKLQARLLVLPALLIAAAITTPSRAQQPAASYGTNDWGGTLLEEPIPYQPSALYEAPSDVEPIDLDREPMFRVAGLADDVIPRPEDIERTAAPDEPQLPPGARNGVFQKITFTSTYLPRMESDSAGFTDLETSIVLGFPFLRPDTPLLVTPRFAVHYIDGPNTPELPPRLYDASVDFTHLRRFGEGPWAMNVSVNLGQYSDFEQSTSESFRVTGHGMAVYEPVPGRKWILGVAYLNRAGATVLPIAGLILQPDDDLSLELVFPRPRIAKRLFAPAPGCDEGWVYIGGEFATGVWTFEPTTAPGTTDTLTYQDIRILTGYERKIVGGLTRRFELGYVFARELEFDSATPDVSLDDTLFARIALSY